LTDPVKEGSGVFLIVTALEHLSIKERKMTEEIYEKLARHLDRLPAGFPRTESGVELRILKRLFDPEEAELACRLQMMPEPAAAVAVRIGIPEAELAEKLETMSRKGLILRADRPEGPLYMAAQYVIGIWEYHVNDLDEELVRDMNEYSPYLFESMARMKTQQLRTIPIGSSLTGEGAVLPYEEARRLIEGQSKILVAPCICRKEHTLVGGGCGKSLETCLVFSGGAHYYEKNGIGRVITQEEALGILKKAEEEGLVLQPTNAKKIINICLCCGDCCQILKNLRRHPQPAKIVHSNFLARVRPDDCLGCEVCLDRCQMEAIEMKDGKAEVDPDRCIGCGLCVPTCAGEAIDLIHKEEQDRYTPPDNIVETFTRLAVERGLFQ
jgi:electron transport complex protein RnfB